MLRPEQMSRVSVTGSKDVMSTVIETVHDLNFVHLVDYEGHWDGFDHGSPVGDAEAAAERLVTVRSLQSILDIDKDTPIPTLDETSLSENLPDIREEIVDLDDRRDTIESDLREVEEQIEAIEPFVELGIDLSLLWGHSAIDVVVGEGDAEAIERTLTDSSEIGAFEINSSGAYVAIAASPATDNYVDAMADPSETEGLIESALVGVEFARIEIPETDRSPSAYLEELEHKKEKLSGKLETVERELTDLELEVGGFLLAAEERLTIQVQKAEAPLQFATTERAFIAEGWIPSERVTELKRALNSAVGNRVDVEEVERASYTENGNPDHQEAVADGGVTMDDGEPPVIQDNPAPAKPFELLVETIDRPHYDEFDPTIILFLTFPAFFGFMIGDVGYGILYMLAGLGLYKAFDSPGIKSLGGIAMWAGGFTTIFGFLYGELFGLHLITEWVWAGHPPIEKGLSPIGADFARLWLVVSLLVGLAHVSLGYIFDFVKTVYSHSFTDAVLESGSWVLLMVGLWGWIFSAPKGPKPEFLYTVFDGHPFAFGFAGFPAEIGLGMLGVAGIGLVLMIAGEVAHEGGVGVVVGVLESLNALVNVLSYARIAAVLLAKAGMAFTVNLLFFGVYVTGTGDHAAWHFGTNHMPHVGDMVHGHEVTSVMFGGLVHGGIAFVIVGVLILVLGHLLVLALGVTSAGLQAVRLEYVEFFGKFYDGGGKKYEPFGYDRKYTTQE